MSSTVSELSDAPEKAPDPAAARLPRLLAACRAHRLFLVLVVCGVLLRGLVQFTYWPAMWNPDSHNYFRAAFSLGWLDAIRPSGYGIFLHFVPGWEMLWPVAMVQHVLALAVAVAIYVVLQRWNVPRWASALATIPVLLDPMQVAIEHFMLADTLSQLMVVSACLALMWRREIGVRQAAIAGVLLGAAATVRSIAGPLVVIAVLWVLLAARRRLVAPLILVLAAALPLGSYVLAFHEQRGAYATSSFGSHYLYLRVALYVDCDDLKVPRYQEVLCPRDVPPAERTANMLLWERDSPTKLVRPPRGMTVEDALTDFTRRVIRQQPLGYVKAVTHHTLRAFLPTRDVRNDNQFDNQWVYSSHFFLDRRTVESKRLLAGGVSPRVNETGARIADAYPFYVPGPVSVLCLVAGTACVLGLRNARGRGRERIAVGGLVLVSLATIVVPAATTLFCWRYQIIQIALLPVAAALGLSTIQRAHPADAVPAAVESGDAG